MIRNHKTVNVLCARRDLSSGESTALCPRPPRSAGTRKVKPVWILLKQETVSGSGISWDICIMQVCTSLQTDNHASTPPLSFLQAGCPSCRPTNSVKALKAKIYSKARIYKSQYTLRYNILTVELQSESVAVAVVTIGQCISSLQPLIHSDTRDLVLSPPCYSALDIVSLLLLLITNYFNVHREYSLCDWFCAYTISFFL